MKKLSRPRRVNTTAKKLKIDQHALQEHEEMSHYEECIDSIDKLFGRKIGAARYEETLRSLYSVEAYPMFTIDRLTIALIKSVSRDVHSKEYNIDARK